jgi:hypothetical protein
MAARVKQQDNYTCLLSGHHCDLVAVNLRRMLFIFPVLWIGWRATVVLPLESKPILAPWQYLRMLRPYLVFAIMLFAPFLFSSLDLTPGSIAAYGSLLIVFAIGVAVWFAMGSLMNRYEFVRLVGYNKTAGTTTIRFSTVELTERALTVLVFPEQE